MQIRLVLAIIGIMVWGYGLASDDATVRLVGIAILASSLALRLVPKRFQRDESDSF